MKYVKYMIGSLIISFGFLLVLVVLVRAMGIEAPKDIMLYLGIAWLVLAILSLALAKRLVRV